MMPDREKVIKGLECHAEVNCVECPYRDGWRTCPFGETLLADALTLLKEQEAVVRCKDCKHYRINTVYPGTNMIMTYCAKTGIAEIKPDWFCADGGGNDNDKERGVSGT